MTLWTAGEAAEATGGTAQGDWAVTGVSIDTRTIQPGDLFVALTAARDGHDFVAQALENGAGAALVSRRPQGVAADAPLLLVDDVQRGLEALGLAGRARCGARVLAVTGSVGKTSTKEMLLQILSDQGRTHASVASYNNHWGVPLTLARMPQDTEFAVIEIGMNHPGEIAPLSRMARPHVALITTVAPAHLEAFADVAAIAEEKAAVFAGLEPGGVAVINADIDTAPILRRAAEDRPVITFGRKAQDFTLQDARLSGETTEITATARGQDLRVRLNAAGAHFACNGLGALAAAEALGADLPRAVAQLNGWSPVTGRGARAQITLPGGTFELIDDSYNANPASVTAALDVLAAADAPGRRIAILGDMKELGPTGPALHAALAAHPAMGAIDQVICIGPLMRHLHDALPTSRQGGWFETSEEAAPTPRPGDVVLIKGSLSMKMARIVDAIREIGDGLAPDKS